jgi:uncharacterized protein (DUF58 family)
MANEPARSIDWRMYAKTDRPMVRLHKDETNLSATILLDKSGSMAFRHSSVLSKHEYARTLAASLAWILIRQRDAVGLFTFDNNSRLHIAPKSTNVQLNTLLTKLDETEPAGETQCGASIESLAQTLSRRGLCVVISDFLDDPASILHGLRHLRFKRQDVMLLRVLDPLEESFSRGLGLCDMRDMESGKTMRMDGHTAREFFTKGMADHRRIIEEACRSLGITCDMILTTEPFAKALMRILEKRRRLF